MAIKESELKSLRRRVETLEKQVAQLTRKNGKRRASTRKRRASALPVRKGALNENQLAVEVLSRAGLLAELTPEEKAMAAEWRALPESRKQEVIRVLETTRFNPPLSETVIQERE